VDLIARRFRGVLIAIVVLGLSAGAVFAGHVVLQAPASAPTASQQGDQDEQADDTDNDAPEADEDQDAEDQDDEDGSGDAAGSHGALVSEAAHMDAPIVLALGEDQFKNHGEFVSCVAHMKDLVLPEGLTQTAFLETLTPTICDGLAEDDEAETALSPDERDEDGTETEKDNHGALVSAAAQMKTPVFTAAAATQFKNHGEFVSCVAHTKTLPEGFTGTTAEFLATVTPDTCAAAAEARAAEKAAKADKEHGKAGQHGKGRAHKRS
jgi:hypothetical protein